MDPGGRADIALWFVAVLLLFVLVLI